MTLADGAVRLRRGRNGLTIRGDARWASILLRLLQTPIAEATLQTLCRGRPDESAKLLQLLEEHGFVARLSAETDSVAAYIARARRVGEEPSAPNVAEAPTSLALVPPGLADARLVAVLRDRCSSSAPGQTAVSEEALSSLLPLSYGSLVSSPNPFRRTVPSAGGLPALSVFVHLPDGPRLRTYRYVPAASLLKGVSTSDVTVMGLCNGQETVKAANGLVTYVYELHSNVEKYGARGLDFAFVECGHAAQNLTSGATALGIGTRCIGSLSDPALRQICRLGSDQIPLYAVALF